jgi:hypothetical protein
MKDIKFGKLKKGESFFHKGIGPYMKTDKDIDKELNAVDLYGGHLVGFRASTEVNKVKLKIVVEEL